MPCSLLIFATALSLLHGTTVSSVREIPKLDVLKQEPSQEPLFGSVIKEDDRLQLSIETTGVLS
jgi:hypothetical protein